METRRTVLSLLGGAGAGLMSGGPASARRMLFGGTKEEIQEDLGYTTAMSISANRMTIDWKHAGTPVWVDVKLKKTFDLLQILVELDKHENTHFRFIKKVEHDPYLVDIIGRVVRAVTELADSLGEGPAYMLLTLVQGIPYRARRLYQQWPTQSLLSMAGDCSDTSLLYAAFLEAYHLQNLRDFGRRSIWVLFSGKTYGVVPRHMLVGVRSHSRAGTRRKYHGKYFKVDGWKYYGAETTGTGFTIGQFPDGFRKTWTHRPRNWTV